MKDIFLGSGLTLSTSNDLSNLQKLSIVCMTKDRPKEFANVITYWRNYPVEFIISDGSETRLTEECVRIESEKIKCHPNFIVKYCRESDFPARFKWMGEALTREFVAFNNDDDFLYAPNASKLIDKFQEDDSVTGIYSWRNFSKDYVSRKGKPSVSKALSEADIKTRLRGSLDKSRNLPDAVWLAILRSESVKRAMHNAFLATRQEFRNDRLSLNVLSVAFIMSNLLSGRFIESDLCLFFKRSFDVTADWTTKSPIMPEEELAIRVGKLRQGTYETLKSSFSSEFGLNTWQEIKCDVSRNLMQCQAYEFGESIDHISFWRRAIEKSNIVLRSQLSPFLRREKYSSLKSGKPSSLSLLLLKWFRWDSWMKLHRDKCCREAFDYLR